MQASSFGSREAHTLQKHMESAEQGEGARTKNCSPRRDICYIGERRMHVRCRSNKGLRMSGSALSTFAFLALTWVAVGDSGVVQTSWPTRPLPVEAQRKVGAALVSNRNSQNTRHHLIPAFMGAGVGHSLSSFASTCSAKRATCLSTSPLLRSREAHTSRRATRLEMMAKNVDYFEILGVERDAPFDVIKKNYYRLALQYHPDVCRDPGAGVGSPTSMQSPCVEILLHIALTRMLAEHLRLCAQCHFLGTGLMFVGFFFICFCRIGSNLLMRHIRSFQTQINDGN
jgi:hypothetical protein